MLRLREMLPCRKCRPQPMLSQWQCFAKRNVCNLLYNNKNKYLFFGDSIQDQHSSQSKLRYIITVHGKAHAQRKIILSEKNWIPIEWGVEKHPLVISYACLALRSARSSQHIDILCPPMVFINMQRGNSINYEMNNRSIVMEQHGNSEICDQQSKTIIKRCNNHHSGNVPINGGRDVIPTQHWASIGIIAHPMHCGEYKRKILPLAAPVSMSDLSDWSLKQRLRNQDIRKLDQQKIPNTIALSPFPTQSVAPCTPCIGAHEAIVSTIIVSSCLPNSESIPSDSDRKSPEHNTVNEENFPSHASLQPAKRSFLPRSGILPPPESPNCWYGQMDPNVQNW